MRIGKKSVYQGNTSETSYVVSGTQILSETNGSNTIYYIYDEKGLPIGLVYNGTTYTYRKNVQGDIIAILNSAGTEVVNYTYNAWGLIINASGSLVSTLGYANPFRYRGYYYDTETGYYYLNSRYYDPVTGRFLNADNRISGAGGDIRGYNLFSYCFNNPVNMSDQDGNWPQWFKDAVKWVTHNVIKPIVDVVKENLSKVDLTYSTGVNVSASPTGLSYNGQIGVSVDTEGNVALQMSVGIGFTTVGTPGISLTRYTSVTNAPSVNKLTEESYQTGGTMTPLKNLPIVVGGDAVTMRDSERNEDYYGLTANIGVGSPGAEVHTELGYTITLTKFNIFDAAQSVYDSIMEW